MFIATRAAAAVPMESSSSSPAPTPPAPPASEPRKPLSVVIATVGTRGDTQPYVALALRLQRRGHTVTLATEQRMESFVRGFGLGWRRIEGDSAGLLFEPEAQRALAEGSFMKLISLTSAWEKRWKKSDVLRSYESALAGADVVVGAGLTMTPSFCVAERLGAAWVPMVLGPTLQTSEFPLMFLKALACGCRCLNRWTYDVAFKMLWDQERPHVNEWRVSSLGLAPMTNRLGIVGEIARGGASLPIIVACSQLSCGPRCKRPSDYPHGAVVGGFAFVPTVEETGRAVDPALTAFLAGAEADRAPVVYLGFGSMPAATPARLLALAADVCARLRVRAVVVAGWSGADAAAAQGNAALCVVPDAPHDWLFPRVRCIVHHAGIGTTAAALRAGVPQVPMPFMLDQPHNAQLAVDLGVAPAAVPYSAKTSSAVLAAAVSRALDPAKPYVAAAARLGEHVRAESAGALDAYAALVERCSFRPKVPRT